MSKKNPTREELRLIVAAGNNEEMKARVEHIYELKSKSNSYTFDVIWHSLWAAFCVVRSALLATGIWDISNEKIKPFCYIVAAIVTGYSSVLAVRKAGRKKEVDLDIQDESNEVLEYAEQFVSDEVEEEHTL